MYFETIGSICVGRFEVFENAPAVRAFFTTRTGGVSKAPFDSLNLGLHSDDPKENVLENRKRLFSALEIPEDRIVRQHQIHEAAVAYVSEPGLQDSTDAMFTDVPNLFLTVSAADCVPILFFEPKKHIAGVIHAGWRGTEKRIAFHTIDKVKNQFHLNGSEIFAAVGPSIGAEHYEVSEEVAQKFDPEFVVRNGTRKPHLDLWKANADQLRQAGIRNISVSNYCTFTHRDLFFSHRASGGKTGRMLGMIGFTR